MQKYIIIFLGLLLSSCAMQKNITQISSFDELEYPYNVSYVKIHDDLSIAYMDEGSGSPILMIHGLGSYAPAWQKTINELKMHYRCIAIDLPSYGKSTKGNYEGSMTSYAEVIKTFLSRMNIEKVTLMGHSMGGQIATIFALAYPDVVDNLILVSPAGFETFTAGQREWFGDVVKARSVKLTPVENLISNVGYNFYKFPSDAQFMIDDRIAMRTASGFDAYCHQIEKSVQGMLEEPVFDYLADLKPPTLVVFGKQDNLIPNRFLNPGKTENIAKQGVERIPNASLKMIDNAGHFVHFEQSSKVNMIFKEFLNK